ncbi:MAG TPA: DMT family protein [Bacteroidia bacterium]|nr:DMT family protein [Bacteroidia bacterium]
MKKGIITILLLMASNSFMTFAWYGHLKYKDVKWLQNLSLPLTILLSWGIALFEYSLMVPANKMGFQENDGPFSLLQLKIIQEVISITVFMGFTLLLFKEEPIKWNHLMGFVCLILAVYFFFKK